MLLEKKKKTNTTTTSELEDEYGVGGTFKSKESELDSVNLAS
jgi:hypothetical protein